MATLRQSVDEKQKEVEAAEKVAEELDVECQSLRKQLARAQVCVKMADSQYIRAAESFFCL